MTLKVGDLVYYRSESRHTKIYCVIQEIDDEYGDGRNARVWGYWFSDIKTAKKYATGKHADVKKNFCWGHMPSDSVFIEEIAKVNNWRDYYGI